MNKSMMAMLSTMNIIRCHAFIKDQVFMPMAIDLFDISNGLRDDSPISSLQILNDRV
jgi:hypothetical protein